MIMMIRILLLLFFVTTFALSNAQVSYYNVHKIKTAGKYYVIYVSKDDITYKIVSKKEKINDCNGIRKNKSYPLNLSKIQILGGSEVDCVSFDEKTVICKEPDADLYIATNLKGLCIIQ